MLVVHSFTDYLGNFDETVNSFQIMEKYFINFYAVYNVTAVEMAYF